MDLLSVIRDRAAGQHGDQRHSVVAYACNSLAGAVLYVFAYWVAPVNAAGTDKPEQTHSIMHAAFMCLFVTLQLSSFVLWLRALIALRTKPMTSTMPSTLHLAVRFIRQTLALSSGAMGAPMAALHTSYFAVIFFGLGMLSSRVLFILSDFALLSSYAVVSMMLYRMLRTSGQALGMGAAV